MASDLVNSLWAPLEEKYFVHDETKAYTAKAISLALKPPHTLSLEALREQGQLMVDNDPQKCRADTNFKGTVEDITIPAPHLPGGIQAKVYKPKVVPQHPVIVIFFRGGGLVAVTIEYYPRAIMSLVNHTNAIIVLGEYRNLPCPEDRFAPFTDCETVTQWVLNNKTSVGGSYRSPVGVAGDSAGGQLASSMSYTFSGQLAFQVIVYPVADVDLENSVSMKEFWTMPGFCGKDMAMMFDVSQLFDEPSQANNPRVNPSAPRSASDPPLSSMPPTLVIVAELDPLRDWGKAYARKLRDAGVPVQFHTAESVPHGFFSQVTHFKSTSARAHRLVAEFIEPFAPKEL